MKKRVVKFLSAAGEMMTTHMYCDSFTVKKSL